MFIFDIKSEQGAKAQIHIQALDWVQAGPVALQCNDNALALILLQNSRCDSCGYFNLLAGCKPLYVEQWCVHTADEADYLKMAGFDDSEITALLS